MNTITHLTAADIRAIFAEVDGNEFLHDPDIERLIGERVGHGGVCVSCAIECATENRRDAGQDDDLYETYADGANYLVDGIASCYCERPTEPVVEATPKFFAGRELETNLWCVKDGSVNGPRCSERFVGADAEQQAEARAAEMNADEAKRTTRYGVAITVVDAQHSYIETADRIGYGKPSKATHGAPTVPATEHTPTDAEDIPQADPWIGTHTTQGTEESAKAYTARQHGTLYSSNSFLVQANEHGVEITNMHTGDGRWLENSKLADDVRAVLTVIPARVPDAKVEAASDLYLLQYFTGVL